MPWRRFSALETQLKSQSFSEISAAYTAALFLPRPLNGLFIPNQFGFFSPLALFCVGDTLLCSELRLASSQGFIYAVVSLSHSFSSCGHIVASTVAQWSALSPHGEKVAGSIPTRDFLSGVCMFILCTNPKDVHVEATWTLYPCVM